MHIEDINEPIKVRADFWPGGKIIPRLFKREDRTFTITSVNATWEDREGNNSLLYFAVLTDRSEDTFQLCFRQQDRTWWLQQVMMEG
ncbi:MAG: hypothetical protein ACLFT2_03565 [Candidatus Brocadiia bacterium]